MRLVNIKKKINLDLRTIRLQKEEKIDESERQKSSRKYRKTKVYLMRPREIICYKQVYLKKGK